MDRRRFLLTSSAVIAVASFPSLVWAQTWKSDPSEFVSHFAQVGIVDILEAKISAAEKAARFRTLFKDLFDIPSIARFVVGRVWRTAQPAEQERFTKTFEDVIVYTWARRFSEYNGQTLKVESTAPDGEDGQIVNSRIVGKNSSDSFAVAWRLRKREDGFRVVDVIVEGVSMAITYRQEYASIMAQQGGIGGLTTQLEARAKDLAKQQG
jgi:phospholipid transport system substrate-binding protein